MAQTDPPAKVASNDQLGVWCREQRLAVGVFDAVATGLIAGMLLAITIAGLSFAISTSGIARHWQAALFLLMAVGLPAVFVYGLRNVLKTLNVEANRL